MRLASLTSGPRTTTPASKSAPARVAAVIPAYQAAPSVGAVVRGTLAQFPEVLVVDDGSDDATLDEARAAGARVVSFRGGRLAVTPIELDDEQAARLRTELPQALYEPGRSQVSLRVPEDPQERFPAVVHAADMLLKVVSAGTTEPLSSPVP